jgi:hypothetical protein
MQIWTAASCVACDEQRVKSTFAPLQMPGSLDCMIRKFSSLRRLEGEFSSARIDARCLRNLLDSP